jgi:hypothetical protein
MFENAFMSADMNGSYLLWFSAGTLTSVKLVKTNKDIRLVNIGRDDYIIPPKLIP